MKKNQKTLWKRVSHIFTLTLIAIALILGVIFSSLHVNNFLGVGPTFNGGYQATVKVLDNNNKKPSKEQVAKGLENKLSPFGNDDVIVSNIGKSRLSVTVGKDRFNQESLQRNIESTGGMFVLDRTNEGFEDLYSNEDAIKAVGGDTRINPTDLFTDDLDTISLAKSQGRAPYLHLGLTKNSTDQSYNFAKVNETLKNKNASYYFITDFESLINFVRNLYSQQNSPLSQDELIDAYWSKVIEPAQKYINNTSNDNVAKQTLRAFFAGNVHWILPGSGGYERNNIISLLDESFNISGLPNGISLKDRNGNDTRLTGIKNVNDLKLLLASIDANGKRSFNFIEDKPVDYYMYRPDATKEDFASDEYKDDRISPLQNNENLGSIQSTFKVITNFFLSDVILKSDDPKKPFVEFNQTLDKIDSTMKSKIVFNGQIYNNTSSSVTIPNLTGFNGGFITVPLSGNSGLKDGLYAPTKSTSAGKIAVASINQNALGIRYRVETIIEVSPTVSFTFVQVALIFVGIIGLLLIIYLLFVYRLLGLFTIIIAVATASFMFLFATLFSITVGPQLLMALFLVIGLVIDLSLILYNSLSDRMYRDKQAVKTAFKIANKETIGLSLDAIIVGLIPNIVMFWVTQGDLKNFATLASIGIFIALILGIIILRLSIWILIKFKNIQQNPNLLAIDTNFSLDLSFKNQYLAHKYTAYLEKHEGKEKYSSKELLKIKQTTEKLAVLNQSLADAHNVNVEKMKLRDQKEVVKIQKQIAKYQKRKETFAIRNWNFLGIGQKYKNHYDLKIAELNDILKAETFVNVSEENQQSLTKKVRVLRTERSFNKAGAWIGIIILFLSILGVILGFTIGPNWSSEFGKGQQFVVYGEQITNSYNNVFSDQKPFENNAELKNEAERIFKVNKTEVDNAQENLKIANDSGNQDAILIAQRRLIEVQAGLLDQFYEYVINHNLYNKIHTNAKDIDLQTWNFKIINNYHFIDPKTGQVTNNDANTVAIIVNSNSTNTTSRSNFRRMLAYLADPSINPWMGTDDDNDDPNSSHWNEMGGILAFDLVPYTTINMVYQIMIVFGILILALIVYIIIRFKWTYYVALALGLILTFGAVISLTIIFRIPISIELLSGFALLISFVLVTMIFVLGKGKALLSVDDKKALMEKFGPELEQSVKVREKKKSLSAKMKALKFELKTLNKKIKKLTKAEKTGEEVDPEKIVELKAQQLELKATIKAERKENKKEFRAYKAEAKTTTRLLARKNFFFKEIYMNLIKFTFKRLVTIGLFYLLIAVVLLTTLAPMFGMGLVVFIGIALGFVITLFIVIPLWVLLERYRLRSNSGFKVFMNNIKVSNEEQIVLDVND